VKFTIKLPGSLVASLTRQGQFTLGSEYRNSGRAARFQARQIIEAGIVTLDQAGPDRCRDIAFTLIQRPHPSRRPAGATEQP
jgi:hypothetical protein